MAQTLVLWYSYCSTCIGVSWKVTEIWLLGGRLRARQSRIHGRLARVRWMCRCTLRPLTPYCRTFPPKFGHGFCRMSWMINKIRGSRCSPSPIAWNTQVTLASCLWSECDHIDGQWKGLAKMRVITREDFGGIGMGGRGLTKVGSRRRWDDQGGIAGGGREAMIALTRVPE